MGTVAKIKQAGTQVRLSGKVIFKSDIYMINKNYTHTKRQENELVKYSPRCDILFTVSRQDKGRV